MMDGYTPADIEHRISETANQIAKGVSICAERWKTFAEADRHYDQQYAAAYLDADGPAHAKRYEAELATMEARATRDTAEAAWKYADWQQKALTEQLRAFQSLGRSVRSQYEVAGRGEM